MNTRSVTKYDLLLALIVGTVSIAVTCNPPRPPTPKPPAMRAVAINVPGVPNPSVYLDTIGTVVGTDTGYALFPMVPESLVKSFVTITATGYKPYRVDGIDLPCDPHHPPDKLCNVQLNVGIELPGLQREAKPFSRLVPFQQVFRHQDGTRIFLIEHSEFQLWRLLCANQEQRVSDLLDRNSLAGYNTVRVFGMFNNGPTRDLRTDPAPHPNDPGWGGLGRFIPSECPDYWDKAVQLLDMASLRDMTVEFTFFADHVIPDVASQLEYWSHVDPLAASRDNLLCEATNEADQTMNKLESLQQLTRPIHCTSSHGSNGGDAWGVTPFWDYVSFHVSSSEWWRKAGHNCYEIGWLIAAPGGWRGACLANETRRTGNGMTVNQIYDMFLGCALLTGGCDYHSDAGKYGWDWTPDEAAWARAGAAGARAIDLTCQDINQYVHRSDREQANPALLRSYQQDSNPGCIADIRK